MDNEYYELLNVPRTASKEEIKKSYKEIARKCHPDKGGDPEKFKKINEAYGVLSDDTHRARYDQFGKNDGQIPNQFPDFFNMNMNMNMFPFHMNRNHMQKRTPDRSMELELTMEEAFHGATIKFRYKRKVYIGDINSSTCSKCNGNGKVVEQMHSPIGVIQNVSVCSTCAGIGVFATEDQFKSVSEIIDIQIPPGTGAGKQLMLRGQADEMPRMETGNIVLSVVIKKHSLFDLVGNNSGDILWNVRVHPLEALTYFYRSIQLPSNERISIEHHPNDKFFSNLDKHRLFQGKGIFDMNGQRGNLLVKFHLEDFYVNFREPLYELCGVSIPSLSLDGTPLEQIPVVETNTQEKPNRQQQQRQQQHHHFGQPQVQECRPS